MFDIQKISQRYNQREDRIEVAIQNEEGKIIHLWLTQRLAKRVINILTKWLHELKDELEDGITKVDIQKIKKDYSVDFSAFEEEGLLLSIDISQKFKNYLIIFRWDISGAAAFKVKANQLKSYFEALIQLYQVAQWELKGFPNFKVNKLTTKSLNFQDFSGDPENFTRTIH